MYFFSLQIDDALLPNIDWSTVGCILVYCEDFYADLGHVVVKRKLVADSSSTPAPAQAPTAQPSSYTNIDQLPSCTELIPGYLNMHWAVDGDNVTLGFEGRPGGDNRWMGFGFSAPDAPGPQMIGSNVVVAGMVGGDCFAFNYYLSSKSQCDFATADGACPDFAGANPLIPTTSADLLACEKVGDKLNIIVTRPLGATDGKDNAWPTDGSRFTVFAMGPVSEGSNATIPVVLYHSLQLPGTNAPQSVNVNLTSTPIKLDFSTGGPNCRDIVAMMTDAIVPTGAPGPSMIKPSPIIDGPTEFTITTGTNKNYPNPPAWGLSLWVNNMESPILVVRRGIPYTFKIEAGISHPVYITTSIIGGGLLTGFSGERIFAGNDTTFGENR